MLTSDAAYFTGILLCWLIPLLVTILRFWLVKTSIRRWTPNEYGLIFTQVMQAVLLAMGIAIILELSENFPSHAPDYILKIFWSEYFVYILTLWSIKISVNLLYLRLTANTYMHKYARASMIFLIISMVALLLFQLLCSLPISCHFVQDGEPGACTNNGQLYVFYTLFAVNIFTDIILFIIPFPMIKTITNNALRIALYILFALGGVVVAFSCIRFGLLYSDPVSNIKIIHILSNAQCGIAAIIAALPGLASPLTRWCKQKGSTSISGELSRYTEGNTQGGGANFLSSALVSEEASSSSDLDAKVPVETVRDLESGRGAASSSSSTSQYVPP